ncbi:MAG: hypothetical protein IKW39_04175, partial [Alphaproteobacteria bacterium]|nr:hypothetical protein [Alphaproteobacteria bacterium]
MFNNLKCIDNGNALFVGRVKEFVFGVNVQFCSLKFDVELNGNFDNFAIIDCSVGDGLLFNNAYFSMNNISIFSNAFWVLDRSITFACRLFLVRKRNEIGYLCK